jgi:hypothetical protein
MSIRSVLAGLLVLPLLWSAPALAGGCQWVDGSDPVAPKDDPGRGVADWQAHFGYVNVGAGMTNAHKLVNDRLVTLKGCLDKAAYARLYADLSVLLGFYGRANAGWKDASDPAAPADDTGRGVANWGAHQNYVLAGVGYTNANKLVGDRLQTLSTAVPKPIYARIYADVSIVIANYARM